MYCFGNVRTNEFYSALFFLNYSYGLILLFYCALLSVNTTVNTESTVPNVTIVFQFCHLPEDPALFYL